MRGGALAWGVALAMGAALVGCGDDAGGGAGGGSGGSGGGDAATGPGQTTGSGDPDGFSLNDVGITLVDPAPGHTREPVIFLVGYKNCPSGESCDDAEVSLNGTVLGRWGTLFPPLPEPIGYDPAAVRALLVPGQDAVLTLTIGAHTSTLNMPCPGDFDVVAPAANEVVASPGPIVVEWTPFTNVAGDSASGLAPNNSGVLIYEWDKDLDYAGVNANVQVPATATSATLDLVAFGELADAGIAAVTAAGPLVETPQGGEGACNFERHLEFSIP